MRRADVDAFNPYGGRRDRFWCPECGGDKPKDAAHLSLRVWRDGGFYCHRCGAKGVLEEQRGHRSSRSVKRRVALAEPQPEPVDLDKLRAFFKGSKPIAGSIAEAYLRERRLATDSLNDVYFQPHFYGRPAVEFVLRGALYEARALQGRYLHELPKEPKCRFVERTKFAVYYSAPDALVSPVVAIVEAPICAITVRQAGVPAIALCGTNAPPWLPDKLAGKTVLVALDSDGPGYAAAVHLIAELQRHSRIAVLNLKPYNDPNKILVKAGIGELKARLASVADDLPDSADTLLAYAALKYGVYSLA